MLLDEDVRTILVNKTRKYLKKMGIPVRFIKIRSGHPIVIVDRDVLYEIKDRSLTGTRITGRYLAQGEKGWIVYADTDALYKMDFSEKLSEVNATRLVLGEEIGRTPKRGRYAMV